jgi:hypothetical protein
MAIAVVYRPPAMTAEQYKESWGGGSPVTPPPGLIFHAGVGESAEFMTVTVWESRDAYDAFAPTFARVMLDKGFRFGAPQILPVHHVLLPNAR